MCSSRSRCLIYGSDSSYSFFKLFLISNTFSIHIKNVSLVTTVGSPCRIIQAPPGFRHLEFLKLVRRPPNFCEPHPDNFCYVKGKMRKSNGWPILVRLGFGSMCLFCQSTKCANVEVQVQAFHSWQILHIFSNFHSNSTQWGKNSSQIFKYLSLSYDFSLQYLESLTSQYLKFKTFVMDFIKSIFLFLTFCFLINSDITSCFLKNCFLFVMRK